MELINFEIIREIEDLADEENSEFLKECFEIYREDAPKLIDQIHQSLETDDRRAISNFAHALKSSSANLGAEQMAERCRELEQMRQDWSKAILRHKVLNLREVYERTVLAMDQFLLSQVRAA